MFQRSLLAPVVCLLVLCAVPASAQIFDNWIFNNDGTTTGAWSDPQGCSPRSGTVTANISKLQYDSTYVYASAYGCPGYTMDLPECRYPGVQNYVFKIPRIPTQQTGTKTAIPKGITGFWIDGVPFYHPGDGLSYSTSGANDSGTGDGIWNRNAVLAENGTLDSNLGHTSGTSPGKYHTHQRAKGLLNYFGDTSSKHSPIIGWAWDGYPVYGPYGYTTPTDSNSAIKRMVSSYQTRSITQRHATPTNDGAGGTTALSASQYGPDVNGTYPLGHYLEDFEYITNLGDLDLYNGRFCVTPEYPAGTYAYFVTIDGSSNSAYPYIIGIDYYGKVGGPGYMGTSQTVPVGATEYQPSCPVTVTPSATSANPSTAMTASVPDSGTGASYSWSITNGTINSGSTTRTVNFTTNSGALTTTVSCLVRNPHGCKATGSANVTATLATPTNVAASLQSSSTAGVSWTASTGASMYIVYRRTPTSGGWVEIGTSASASYSDSSLPSNAAYIYRVVASNSDRSIASSPSLPDYVTTYGYTDEPPSSGATNVKAQHFTELRSAISALDTALGVTSPTWTDTSLTGVAIKATHMTELRNAINAFRTSAALTSVTFTDSSLTTGVTVVQKVHLTELRVAVKGYCASANCQ